MSRPFTVIQGEAVTGDVYDPAPNLPAVNWRTRGTALARPDRAAQRAHTRVESTRKLSEDALFNAVLFDSFAQNVTAQHPELTQFAVRLERNLHSAYEYIVNRHAYGSI